jgi:hypothetical protein
VPPLRAVNSGTVTRRRLSWTLMSGFPLVARVALVRLDIMPGTPRHDECRLVAKIASEFPRFGPACGWIVPDGSKHRVRH